MNTTSPTEFDQRFSHHFTTVNGVRLHYVIGGQGEPVVLLHGWLGTWYVWRRVMPALVEHYTVIAPDMRGYGDSDKPETGYDSRTLQEDIYQLVQQLGFHRIFLVGHDMGAPPAYAYAAEHPDDVRRLVYLDEPVPGFGMEELLKFSPETAPNGGLWWFFFNMVPNLPETLAKGREREFLSWFYDYYLYDRSSISDDVVDEYVRCYSQPNGWRGGIGCYRELFKSEAQNREYGKQKLKIPVLALGGAKSMGPHVQQLMQQVAEDVRGGSVEHCGHFIPEERPDYLVEQLLEFFGEEP